MYVILDRVHRCTKAKQNTVLFFEFPDLLFERHSYLKSVSLSNLKSATVCTPKKVYTPSSYVYTKDTQKPACPKQ